MYIDLAAEKIIAAERGIERIAVEVKSFLGPSLVTDFHTALGQFLNYRLALDGTDPDRVLYLAVPEPAYSAFFMLLSSTKRDQTSWCSPHRLRSRDGGHRPMDKVTRHGELIEDLLREYEQP